MNIDAFALPFLTGTIFLVIVVLIRFTNWIIGLSKIDKLRIVQNLFTQVTLKSIREAFNEGLLHLKVWKQNRMLGYMHMSLAFGWFLIIIIGHLEAASYYNTFSFPFQNAIFFRYYATQEHHYFFREIFATVMDLLLIYVISGVFLAYYKRFDRKRFGMKKTTRLQWRDYIALVSLWLIFPLRFFAECNAAGLYQNGSIITQPIGNLLNNLLPLELINEPVWFAYSVSLGLFFVMLPYSRYFHIPTEVLYIFLKNSGIKLKKHENTYARVQTFSCSRCGICLDSCQMNDAGIKNTQSVYVLKNIRNRTLTDSLLFNCLLCGRCEQVCPVDIKLNDLRLVKRIEKTQQYNSAYDFLKKEQSHKASVIYFAGCMTHLTPSILKSMKKIFQTTGTEYWFMDEQKSACCGRPLMQAGQREAALKLIEMNRQQILGSGAHTLVVSCPICYKVFIEDYHMPHIRIMHHSEYILEKILRRKILPIRTKRRIVYHDPCELGRGTGIYEQPRALLRKYGTLVSMKNEKDKSFCCGGSLSNLQITSEQRRIIRDRTLDNFQRMKPEFLVTACPLCKKTFAGADRIPVADISEIVAESLVNAEEVKELEEGAFVRL